MSNRIYAGKTTEKEKIRAEFTYVDLVRILMLNIDNQEIVVPNKEEAYHHLMSKSRKLKVHLLGCYTATDEKTIFGTITEESFASKFAICAHNVFNATLVCDITGINGVQIPVGTKPDLLNSLKYIIGSETFETGFHKCYMQPPYFKGNFYFNLFNYVPQHKPDYDYKVEIVPSPKTSAQQVIDQDITHVTLDMQKAKNRAIEQDNGERTLQLAHHILKNADLANLHQEAASIKIRIQSGNIHNNDIVKAYASLMRGLNDHFNPEPGKKPRL